MRSFRSFALFLAVLALAGCTGVTPGWTYAPAPSTTPIPSIEPSAPASGTPSEPASAAPSAPASVAPSAPASGAPSGAPSGGAEPVFELMAQNIAFDKSELTVPAGQPFKIHFVNNDATTPHNVAIHQGDLTGAEVFKGEIFPGVDERTYDIPALPAGTYAFVCSVHPNMTGTLTAG